LRESRTEPKQGSKTQPVKYLIFHVHFAGDSNSCSVVFLVNQDPNADINEMFDMVEQVASAPKKFFDSMFKK
jgi:hypothetical protein